MANFNIFHNTTNKCVTEKDYPQAQIVNDDMNQIEIQGRKDHLPKQQMSPSLNLSHVTNAGDTPGGSA